MTEKNQKLLLRAIFCYRIFNLADTLTPPRTPLWPKKIPKLACTVIQYCMIQFVSVRIRHRTLLLVFIGDLEVRAVKIMRWTLFSVKYLNCLETKIFKKGVNDKSEFRYLFNAAGYLNYRFQ